MGLDFSVRHNVEAMFASRQTALNYSTLNKALERLSSGYRINRASDDAAGLAVSERLRAQVRGLHQASRNIQDAMSVVQVAEAGLTELTDIIQRIRELAVQASNGIYTDSDRSLIQVEIDQLLNEINRSMTTVEFNRLKLFDGTFSSTSGTPAGGGTFMGSLVFQVGANEGMKFSVFVSTMSVRALGLYSMFSSSGAVEGNFTATGLSYNGVLSQAKASSAIGVMDSAMNVLNRRRAELGALQNRLEHTLNFVGVAVENTQAAESRIRDTDMAEEVINFTKSQVLVQASQSMLAQANLKPTSILQLLT